MHVTWGNCNHSPTPCICDCTYHFWLSCGGSLIEKLFYLDCLNSLSSVELNSRELNDEPLLCTALYLMRKVCAVLGHVFSFIWRPSDVYGMIGFAPPHQAREVARA